MINVSRGELSINRMVKKVMDNYGICNVFSRFFLQIIGNNGMDNAHCKVEAFGFKRVLL